jgi:hypothetical protein
MRASQPLAAVAQMHAHRGAGVVGVLALNRKVDELVLVEHVAQGLDLIEFCNLR